MKKVLSMIACLSLVVTMFAGMTVSAATYGSPVATATFEGFVDENGDEYTAESTGDLYALVNIAYAGFENLVAYSSSGKGSNKKETVTGIAAVGIEVALEDTTNYENYGGARSDGDVFFAWGDGSANRFGGNAGSFADYVTETEGDVLQMWVIVNDKDASTKLNIVDAKFTVKEITASTETASDNVQLEKVGCTIPAFNTPAAPSLTATTLKAWDTGLGLLVIAKVDGTYTTKGINLTKDGAPYVLAAPSKYAGMGPDFPATKDATDDGYYGVYIRNAAAGSYVAKAYADTTYDAGITVTVAE